MKSHLWYSSLSNAICLYGFIYLVPASRKLNCYLDTCSELSQRSYSHTFSSGLAFIFICVYKERACHDERLKAWFWFNGFYFLCAKIWSQWTIMCVWVFVSSWSISVSKGTCSELLAVHLSKMAEMCVVNGFDKCHFYPCKTLISCQPL